MVINHFMSVFMRSPKCHVNRQKYWELWCIPMKIASNILFINEMLEMPHNYFFKKLQHFIVKLTAFPIKTTNHQWHTLTALSIMHWSQCLMRCCYNLSKLWDFSALNPLLKNTPCRRLINWVKVWTVRRPQRRWDEVGCLALEQILDVCLACDIF